MARSKIGILGDGNVGSALARGLQRSEHDVRAVGRLADQQLTALVAGDDAAAKATVMDLARDIGFDAVDAGPLAHARLMEPLGYLNIQLAYKLGVGNQIAFKLVRG